MTGRGAAPLVGVIALVLLLGAVALGGLGLVRGSSGGEEGAPRPASTTVVPTSTTPSPRPSDPRASARPAGRGPTLHLRAAGDLEEGMFPPPDRTVGELEPSAVLTLVVTGFPEFATARASQCVAGDRVTCRNSIGVQFDVDGTATFQYLVDADPVGTGPAGACGLAAAPCSIVVQDVDGESRAEIGTVFGDPVPSPGRLTVSPRTGLQDGQAVQVRATGQRPGTEVEFVVCAAPARTGASRCGAPGPAAAAVVDADGDASATLRIDEGPVGTERVFCRREQRCAVVVRAESAVVRTPLVPIGFAEPPGAVYDDWRLALGLGCAGLLTVAATWLVRRTDWAPVGEVAAPEIDQAAYADLDAIIAALPPEELEDATPHR
jgi:hypothetical protein